ncbi:MAG TPA: metallophosphoesterase [Thermotogota bacterium]|nr:metallophosphoesterase [Thermotogota bacterium]HRW35142.1 metallophosphoesterase [Thermotogota bacterium]
MIVAIGDIHGCFDPLKALINAIEGYRNTVEDIEYIFIGDYIDRGPSTKEVLDFLIHLKAQKTFLMGNHEHMLLVYYKGSHQYQSVGEAWLRKKNGGLRTLQALDPTASISHRKGFHVDSEIDNRQYSFVLDHQYQIFFESLKFAQIRELQISGKRYKLLFSHSVPNHRIPIQELIDCESYEAFDELNARYAIPPAKMNLWNRDFLTEPFEGAVLIHGHTPTIVVDRYIGNERTSYRNHTEQPILEEPATHFVDFFTDQPGEWQAGVAFSVNKQSKEVVQIDIDCGAVYGSRLSAICFPCSEKERRTMDKLGILMNPIYVNCSGGYYKQWSSIQKTGLTLSMLPNE